MYSIPIFLYANHLNDHFGFYFYLLHGNAKIKNEILNI